MQIQINENGQTLVRKGISDKWEKVETDERLSHPETIDFYPFRQMSNYIIFDNLSLQDFSYILVELGIKIEQEFCSL